MRWNRLRRLPLARALALVLLPTFVLLAGVEHSLTARDARRAANAAYDRSLLGAVKAIDANISTESGGLSVELPYRLFEFFELTASGPVHFRVATADGLVEVGSADLPQPADALQLGIPQVYDGEYFGERVRVAAYLRELDRPTADSPNRQVVIQVAESFQSREEFTRVFLRRAATSNFVFLALTLCTVALAIGWVLRPLRSLSEQIAGRSAAQLQPVAAADVASDVRPLVDAINQHMQRVEALTTAQRQFLDDASHQLRTHLTTLRMQADYAAAEDEPASKARALDALRAELQRVSRSTNQLLGLARSDSVTLALDAFDALDLLKDIAREYLPRARARQVDLGVEGSSQQVVGDRDLLHEAVINLVANAVAYVPEGGTVTLSCAQDALGASIGVHDDGPGIPAALRAGALQGTRFARTSGSGLGLAIANSVARRHAGVLRLEQPEGTGGFRATLWWPRNGTPGDEEQR